MSPSRPSLHETSVADRKAREAGAARQRLPVVWIVLAATIALVFVVAFVLAALL